MSNQYEPDRVFAGALRDAQALTTAQPATFEPELKRLFASTGVALVWVPELPNMPVSGAIRWLSPERALIQLSLRYKTDDHLWFSLFHEAAHVLKHGRKLVFIEGGRKDSDEEREANRFAADILVPRADYEDLVARKPLSNSAIVDFASRVGVAPGVVVGRLQHDRHLPFDHGNQLKKRLEWAGIRAGSIRTDRLLRCIMRRGVIMLPRLVTRVRLSNYRSIAACDVPLGPLVFLVGPNGSGKSNFLDALRLTNEALRTSLEHALRERGGIAEVRRRSSGHPTHFGVRLDVQLRDDLRGWYAFRVGAEKGGGYVVQDEECWVGGAYYRVHEGVVQKASETVMPPASSDRLYLVTAAGLPVFRAMYDALLSITFLSPVPDVIRRPQSPDPGDFLARDAHNLAGVFDRLTRGGEGARERVEEYLQKVVAGVRSVEVERALGLETLAFRQTVAGRDDAWRFNAVSMSDGTLRAFAVLVALFRPTNGNKLSPMLVGLEEPETALHPAAAGVLLDALLDAAEDRQVVVTTHSPDLLDNKAVATENILAVTLDNGQTQVGRIDEAGRAALHEHLYTAGELLRLAQLAPDPADSEPRQLDLFAQD